MKIHKVFSRLAKIIPSVSILLLINTPSIGALSRPHIYPAFTQLTQSIAMAVDVAEIPSGEIIPPIGSAGSVDFYQPHPFWSRCFVQQAVLTDLAKLPSSCTFGDQNSKVIVGVFGDSNAAMWAPALDAFGVLRHVKVLLAAHVGCTFWSRPWSPANYQPIGALSEPKCARWRQEVLGLFRRERVSYVIPISIDNTNIKDQVKLTRLTSAIQESLVEFRQHGFKPVVLDPAPAYAYPADYINCLTRENGFLNRCMVSSSSVSSSRLNFSLNSAARAANVPVIKTRDLFCSPTLCPLFVQWEGRFIQVHRDGTHITDQYGQLIAGVLAPRISSSFTQAH